MFYLILLIVGNILLETNGSSLNCTNDYDRQMDCCFYAHGCTKLRMTVQSTQSAACEFESSVSGCCCSMQMKFKLLIGDCFLANVFRDEKLEHTQKIRVDDTIKPPPPNITSVTHLNEMHQIQFQTNAKRNVRDELSAIVTYWREDDPSKESAKTFLVPTVSKLKDENSFHIHDSELDLSATYVVSLKTKTGFGVFSDSSNEEKIPAVSPKTDRLIALIVCLCIVTVVVSSGAFCCFIKIKGKVWDIVESPKLLNIKPKHVILKPEAPLVQSVSVEPLILKGLTLSNESLSESSGRSGQTSGFSTASSSLDYANTQPDMETCVREALKNIFPNFAPTEDTFSYDEPVQRPVILTPLEIPPSLIEIYNQSYSAALKFSPVNDVDVRMPGDSGYNGPRLHDFIVQPHVSTIMETEMSYQPCVQPSIATSDSPKLLTEVYEYHDFEKVVEQSNAISSTESQSLMLSLTNSSKTADVVQSLCGLMPHEMTVDHGYHCA